MATIITCDCEECNNTDVNEIIYSISDEALKKFLGFTYEENICQECVDEYNKEYPNSIINDPDWDDFVILNTKRSK